LYLTKKINITAAARCKELLIYTNKMLDRGEMT